MSAAPERSLSPTAPAGRLARLVEDVEPLLADAGRPVLIADLEGRVLRASAELGQALGVDPDLLCGAPLYDVGPDGSPTDVVLLITGLLTNGRGTAASRAVLRSSEGDPLGVRLRFSLLRDRDRLPAGLLVEVEDDPGSDETGAVALDARPGRLGPLTMVPDDDEWPGGSPDAPPLPTRSPGDPPPGSGAGPSEDREGSVAADGRPTLDPLTGLPDRTMLLRHLESTLARTGAGASVAVGFLDLDRFKRVNDTQGHEAGDRLLQLVADRVRGVLRPRDLLARLGGDEFVAVCEGVVDDSHARELMHRITSAVHDEPFEIGDTRLEITASGGVAVSTDHLEAERLLREADEAMYRSKRLGRGRLEIYDEDMRAATTDRLQLADDLAGGLDAGEITVHYQPVFDLRSREPVAVEALARWRHPERGLVDPAAFLAIAEEAGLVVQPGLAVLHQACGQAARWREALGRPIPVHVNLSARQLAHLNLPLLIESLLEASGLPAQHLCVELTEATVMEDESVQRENLDRICALGCCLVIDDFGTGVSSLRQLAQLPVRSLKIDGAFAAALDDDRDRTVTKAVIDFADALGIQSIAEGVETAEQAAALTRLGCDAGQGFHLARPVAAHAILGLLRSASERADGASRA